MKLESLAAGALLLGVAASLKIALANVLLGIAFLAWTIVLATGRARRPSTALLVPVAVYIAVSILSAAVSADPRLSFSNLGDLLTLGLIPMIVSLLDGRRWDRLLLLLALVSSASAVVGLAQYAQGASTLENRLHGLANHYMTFAGWTLAVTLLLLADMAFSRDRRRLIWTAPATLLGAGTLALSLTRGAWVGFAVAIALMAVLSSSRILLLVPLAAVILLLAMPRAVVERAVSIVDLDQPSVQERVFMLRAGIRMVRDHPILGVGPGMVQPAYANYRETEAPARVPHLHNNAMQIAAERGLVGLAAYLGILLVFAVHVWRALRLPNQVSRPAIIGCLLAVVGVTVAGVFEYNWGDAEVWIVTLVCLAAPFAEER
ncbi:MAG: O-antigen ligase family protein [Thermoanaerobaculales bacterium]